MFLFILGVRMEVDRQSAMIKLAICKRSLSYAKLTAWLPVIIYGTRLHLKIPPFSAFPSLD